MGKRVLLGVQKEKKPIKQNKKRLLKKVVDYLTSDSYMYATLLSNPPPLSSTPPKIISSPSKGDDYEQSRRSPLTLGGTTKDVDPPSTSIGQRESKTHDGIRLISEIDARGPATAAVSDINQ
ncbi:uncharacterized protein LOC122082510 [Macadamia integrifolia]|uniref:uncharacterized protein LOC122082510 n=1 Tax=Macadamia integrifolia TaxID=60698 RepID=UPI001C4F24E5|nr:uncharacterized protein LOC122082510 [Macadamia integrifolia]